jgi:hypothetical protein
LSALPLLRTRIAEVHDSIARARSVGGWSHDVTLVAVTKTHHAATVQLAVAAGLTDLGENRVQEAREKQDQLPGLAVRWHLIGSLQRNKARHAVGRFHLIHSVDRADLAVELARRVPPGSRQAVLLQVNCSGEAQKGGVPPAQLPALLHQVEALPALELRGLMTMAAFDADEPALRRSFGQLRALRDDARRQLPGCTELSMGMSGDFLLAVEEGATMVRIGSALFGERT